MDQKHISRAAFQGRHHALVTAPARESQFARRALWIIRGDEGYGIRRAALDLAQGLKESSVEVGFVAMETGSFTEETATRNYQLWILGQSPIQANIRQRGWRFLSGVGRLFASSLATQKRLEAVIRSFDPDWLHVNVNSLLLLAGMAARKSATPVYWQLHNTIRAKLPFGIQALGLQLLCRLLRVTPLANSNHTGTSLGSLLCKPHTLHLGVDPEHFSPSAVFCRVRRSDLGLHRDTPVFTVVARMVPEKAQDRVVAAAINLLQSGHRFALLLVGGPIDTSYFSSLQQQIDHANCDDRIRLIGSVDDPRPYYEISDVVINSRTHAEPFGLSIVEAMFMERPVLACALGGPAETVVDGRTGWLIADSSIRGFELGIRRALHATENWKEMGRSARERASAHFSLEAMTHNYLNIVTSN